MWEQIVEYFRGSPRRLEVAQTIIRHGFRVEAPGVIKCRDVHISLSAIGAALDLDRRTVRATTEDICANEQLFKFFSRLQPAGASLEQVSDSLGYGVVTIFVESPENAGILSQVTSTISGYGIAIRQVIAEDVAIFRKPCLKVMTEGPLPGSVIHSLTSLPGVSRVIIDK